MMTMKTVMATGAAQMDAEKHETEVFETAAAQLEPLAWSMADEDAAAESYTWGTTWLRGLLMLACAMAIAAAIGAAGWMAFHSAPTATPVSSAPRPSATASPPPAAPAPAPTTTVTIEAPPPAATEVPPTAPLADEQFITALHSYGITTSQGSAAEIRAGHYVCTLVAEGQSPTAVALRMEQQNPSLTSLGAAKFVVDSAIAAYCPDASVP